MNKKVGPYSIVESVGHGGMGVVYRAIHEKIEQTVAIKAIPPYYSQDSYIRKKFLNEAKLQAKLSHPNIVNIINYIESHESIYLVMEYVKGETLEQRIKRQGFIPVDEAVEITGKILDALQYMHSKGIVHRDLKPSNIMFTENGAVKVTDFGISKLVGQKGQTTTILAGSYTYISPEEITGQGTTYLSDIYSFGITLYHMLTGRVPFDYDTEYRVMKAHLEEKPKDLRKFNKDIPFRLSITVLKAISKEPEDRFKNPEEFKTKVIQSIYSKNNNSLFYYARDFSENLLHKIKPLNKSFVPAGIVLLLLISGLLVSSFIWNNTSSDTAANQSVQSISSNVLDEIVLMGIAKDESSAGDNSADNELARKRDRTVDTSGSNNSINDNLWKIRK